MDINQDDDDNLAYKIRHFLTKYTNFRDESFDPAPYLIKVLKQKEANQQLLVEKQAELINLQNQAQQLIQEITVEQCQEFISLLNIPEQYGQQLEGLKQNIANVKRKVKETKSLLLQTQKDIQQIHLNCVLNKLVHKRLKQIELKLSQYETAALALKNHLYLDCAQNLPTFNGASVLENTLMARSQNLKLRFLHQAIEQVRIFLYFTPRLTLPTVHMFFQRTEDREEIFNEALHQPFFKRYKLFKKARCEEYLSSIWSIQSLEEKTGRVAVIHDIIKGIMRIGKSSQITQSLSLDVRKSVSNIYQVLSYFFSKQLSADKSTKQGGWFTSNDPTVHTTFISVLFCVGAALLRKMVIVRKICNEYQLEQVTQKLSTQIVLQIIRDQIIQLIRLVYFSEANPLGTQVQSISQDLVNNLKKEKGFIFWPYFKKIIENCFQILCQQLQNIEEKIFTMTLPQADYYTKSFQSFHHKFLSLFHQQFLRELETIFLQGRGFNPQSLDSILSQKDYPASDVQFCKKYCSEQKKSLRQFFNLISYLNSCRKYFNMNNFQPLKFKQYSLFLILFFYLKLNYTLYRYIVSPTLFDKVNEARVRDPKVRNKEKHQVSLYGNIVIFKDEVKPKSEKKYFKNQEGDHPQMRSIQQLKMIRSQIEMLLYYLSQNYNHLQEIKGSLDVDRYESQIQKNQPINYDENVNSKLLRVWQLLIKPYEASQPAMDLMLCAVFRKIVELYFVICACLYIETGAY